MKAKSSFSKPGSKRAVTKGRIAKRRPWTHREDQAIHILVQEYGTAKWTLIADQLSVNFKISGRTGKQCRERWHNHLDPAVVKETWSLQEELSLFEKHRFLGNKWAEISKFLPGRTDNSIKNHFYSTHRKQFRREYGKDASKEELKKHDEELTLLILAALRQQQGAYFAGSQEAFWSDNEEFCFSLSELPDIELFVTGYQIPLPPPGSVRTFEEEAPAEFMWVDDPLLSSEVFMMPLTPLHDDIF